MKSPDLRSPDRNWVRARVGFLRPEVGDDDWGPQSEKKRNRRIRGGGWFGLAGLLGGSGPSGGRARVLLLLSDARWAGPDCRSGAAPFFILF
jgi:hypothetical protein